MDTREKGLETIRALGREALLGSGKHHEIEINYTAESGTHYEGIVIVHRPNARELMKMAGIKTMYIQKQFVDADGTPLAVDPLLIEPSLVAVAEVVATLKTVVDKCPEWLLNPEDVEDIDLLFHVNARYQAWRNSFRKQAVEEPANDNERSEA